MEITGATRGYQMVDGYEKIVRVHKNSDELSLDARKIKDGVSLEQIKKSVQNNGQDEIVFENDKGRFIISAGDIEAKGKFGLPKFGLPAVGENISFGAQSGKVIFSDNETEHWTKDTQKKAKLKIDEIIIKTPGDLAKEKMEKITEAENKSDTNKNTLSIYGSNVTVDDAKSWIKNNPYLAQSHKLVSLADFQTIDGKVDANELAKIASSGGAVVLNGPNSFYLPGMKKDNDVKEQPQVNKNQRPVMTEQEKYYKQQNAKQNAELAGEVGGAVLNAIGNIAR